MKRAVLMALAFAACFDPQLGDRPFLCGAGNACPPGYHCDGRFCVRGTGGGGGEAGLPDARPVDGPLVDAPVVVIDAPLPADAAAVDARPPDARPPDARPPDATPADAPPPDGPPPECLAACGPESCGTSSCGRSACGYPCKPCAVGTIGDPCIDHYGQMLDEGASGVRDCIAEPARMESCLCTGGGASSWTGCTGGCFDEGCSRAHQIGCGFQSCAGSEICCRKGRDSFCTTGSCGTAPTSTCDGPEDCPGGVCCATDVIDGAKCVSGTSCGGAVTHCHSTADCPATALFCCPTGPTTGVKACFATVQLGGCN